MVFAGEDGSSIALVLSRVHGDSCQHARTN